MSTSKTTDLQSLPNIGQVIAGKLAQIGITTVSQFMDRDPYQVFDEMRAKVDPDLCRCALASIVGAHRGVKWHKMTGESTREYERRHPEHRWGKC